MTHKEFLALKRRVAVLEKYRANLSKYHDKISEFNAATIKSNSIDAAKLWAVQSVVIELAEQLGIEPTKFKEHFKKRFAYWYQHVLTEIEDGSPYVAALIDDRPDFLPDIGSEYPPLFD